MGIEELYASLSIAVNELQTQVAAITGDGQGGDLTDEVNTLKQDVDNLKNKDNVQTTDIAKIQSSLTDITGKIAALTNVQAADIARIQSSLNEITGKITTLTTRVTNQEGINVTQATAIASLGTTLNAQVALNITQARTLATHETRLNKFDTRDLGIVSTGALAKGRYIDMTEEWVYISTNVGGEPIFNQSTPTTVKFITSSTFAKAAKNDLVSLPYNNTKNIYYLFDNKLSGFNLLYGPELSTLIPSSFVDLYSLNTSSAEIIINNIPSNPTAVEANRTYNPLFISTPVNADFYFEYKSNFFI